MSSWRTIETAPKDGQFLAFEMCALNYGPNYEGQRVPRVFICNWWKGDTHNRADWTDNHGGYAFPTHWMPLPDPPSDEPPQRKE